MEDKIRDIIKSNLPEQAAGEMKAYIEQAESTKKRCEQIENLLKDEIEVRKKLEIELRDCRKTNQEHLDELAAWEKREAFLNEKQKLLNEREMKLELTLMTKERDCAVKNSKAIFDLVDKVFRNPVSKKTVLSRVQTPVTESCYENTGNYDNNGNAIMGNRDYTTNHDSQNTEETTETIE